MRVEDQPSYGSSLINKPQRQIIFTLLETLFEVSKEKQVYHNHGQETVPEPSVVDWSFRRCSSSYMRQNSLVQGAIVCAQKGQTM